MNYKKEYKGFLSFIKNIPFIPIFFGDPEVSVYRKIKVVFLITITAGYFLMPIDLIADFLFFGLGYMEDIAIAYFLLGKANEELEGYKAERKSGARKEKTDENVIDVDFREK